MLEPRQGESPGSHLLFVELGVRTIRPESLARARNRPNQNKLSCVRTMTPRFSGGPPSPEVLTPVLRIAHFRCGPTRDNQ
jgi:hypothetical protein